MTKLLLLAALILGCRPPPRGGDLLTPSAGEPILAELDRLAARLHRGRERVAYHRGRAEADALARLHRRPVGRRR